VKAVTEKFSLFFEDLQEHFPDEGLATVCGTHNHTRYKNPTVECIRNYREHGMRQVELTNLATADIDMSLLQQLITEQKLSTFTGPIQPATFNRAPKGTYHARRREPVELDKSKTASATFWAEEYSPPKHTTRKGANDTTISTFTALPTQTVVDPQNQHSEAILTLIQSQTSMTAELKSLRKAAIDNAKESESLRTALQQPKQSTEQIQSDQGTTKRTV